MTATPSDPLTDAEIAHLEFLLGTPAFKKQSMGLDEIQGYVAAILSGPEPVAPKRWLTAVLGDPDYESDAQADEVKALLLRFHDEIARDLKAGEELGLVLNLTEPDQASGESDYDYAAWCQAYLDGVESASVPWNEAGDEEEIDDLLFPISLLAGEIDPKALKQVRPRELASLLQECREDLPMLAVDIYKYFRALRERPKVTAQRPGSTDKVSGAGKKKLH